jgi:hypothetical protein
MMNRSWGWTFAIAAGSAGVALLVAALVTCTPMQRAIALTAADVVRRLCTSEETLDSCTRRVVETACPSAAPMTITIIQIIDRMCAPDGTVDACVDRLLSTCPVGPVDAGPGGG